MQPPSYGMPMSDAEGNWKELISSQPMVGGTVKSEPGFSPQFNGELVGTGNDYIHADPDGKRLRLNAHGVIR